MSPLVLANDDGIRPAGPPDACFYCRQKVGTEHGAECAAVNRKARVRYVFEVELEVPAHWTPSDIEFHRNESSWCADNAIDDLTRSVGDAGCLCGKFKAEFVEMVAGEPYTKARGPVAPGGN